MTADVAARVDAGQVDGRLLAFVGGALHQSKIAASLELAAASEKLPDDLIEDGSLPTDIHVTLRGILEACGGDPFMAVGSLIESSHAMPADARHAGRCHGLAAIPEARSAAVLFLLNPVSGVRHAVAGALGQVAASLTPIDVRG